jgi:hypothetical protein
MSFTSANTYFGSLSTLLNVNSSNISNPIKNIDAILAKNI